MAYLSCLVCGRLSDQSYCPVHRSRHARGYDSQHVITRKNRIRAHPYCAICGHTVDPETGHCGIPNCKKCPLQLHHKYGKSKAVYEILCAVHNRAIGKPGYSAKVN